MDSSRAPLKSPICTSCFLLFLVCQVPQAKPQDVSLDMPENEEENPDMGKSSNNQDNSQNEKVPDRVYPEGKDKITLLALAAHQTVVFICSWILPFLFLINCQEGHRMTLHIIMAILLAGWFGYEVVLISAQKAHRRAYAIVNNAWMLESEESCILVRFIWKAFAFFLFYIWPLISTQIAFINMYLDVCFLSIVWNTDMTNLSIIETTLLSVTTFPKLCGLIYIVTCSIRNYYHSEWIIRSCQLLELDVQLIIYRSNKIKEEMLQKWICGISQFVVHDVIQSVIKLYYQRSNGCGTDSDPTVLYASIAFSLITSSVIMVIALYQILWFLFIKHFRMRQLVPDDKGVLTIVYTKDLDRVNFKVDSGILIDKDVVCKEIHLNCTYLTLSAVADLLTAYIPLVEADKTLKIVLSLDLYTGSYKFLCDIKNSKDPTLASGYKYILEWRELSEYYLRISLF